MITCCMLYKYMYGRVHSCSLVIGIGARDRDQAWVRTSLLLIIHMYMHKTELWIKIAAVNCGAKMIDSNYKIAQIWNG